MNIIEHYCIHLLLISLLINNKVSEQCHLSAIYIYVYDIGCQICCNWSRLKPGFNLTAQ